MLRDKDRFIENKLKIMLDHYLTTPNCLSDKHRNVYIINSLYSLTTSDSRRTTDLDTGLRPGAHHGRHRCKVSAVVLLRCTVCVLGVD